ncbi:MAG TPA: histidinol-phosphatase HisJ family protein [Mobilitalea sp.]|nr:histidinol-phosphatase HisJ family protein [Mobilitalea sp.]
MIKADYHVHSEFSSDSQAPMEQMIDRAIELGMKKICFTDHMDYDYPEVSELRFVFDPDTYVKKLEELKKRYYKKIEILTGIELGLQTHLADRMHSLVKAYPFDFIIGSSHVVDHMDPYYPDYWENRSVQDGIYRYFESILENCKVYQGFSVYGHIDYIIRYVPGQKQGCIDYNYSDYTDLLDEVLKTIISHGKGIEINSAGLKYGLSHPHPKQEVIRRYKELGGEIITIGSDAHKPEHLAYDFHLIPELLQNLGFQYYTTFVQGKPVFEKL